MLSKFQKASTRKFSVSIAFCDHSVDTSHLKCKFIQLQSWTKVLTHLSKTGLFRRVSQLLLSMIVGLELELSYAPLLTFLCFISSAAANFMTFVWKTLVVIRTSVMFAREKEWSF